MRYVNTPLLALTNLNQNVNSDPLDANQLLKLSIVASATATIGGTLQLQVSNDPCPYSGPTAQQFVPTNWVNLGSALTFAGAGSQLIAQQDVCWRWIRAVWTDTAAVVNTITAVADSAGSLNNKYFLFNTTAAGYYVWFNVNSAGVDPMIAGRTGIEVALATGATAATVGGAIRTAVSGSGAAVTVTGASTQAILTNNVGGPAAVAVDGAAPTGFTFAATVPSGTLTVNAMALSL